MKAINHLKRDDEQLIDWYNNIIVDQDNDDSSDNEPDPSTVRHVNRLKYIFAVNRIIYDKYWRSYSKVLSFDCFPSKISWSHWSVTVITCDINGNPIPGEVERTHCTEPNPDTFRY